MRRFENHVVMITGAGNGIGRASAIRFAEEGARIVCLDLAGDANEKTADECRALGAEATALPCDITNRESIQSAVNRTLAQWGRIDTLVNSAAIFPRKPILEITDLDWDVSNGVNVKGTYHMMVAAVHQMRRQEPVNNIRGRIVNITSVDAFKAHPQNAHYAATKAAVVSLTRSFAHEVAPDGILVNSVAPAGMATERARELGFLEELARASPLGRGGEPREIAEWVLMAGSSKNSYMTGENIIVSGGYIYA